DFAISKIHNILKARKIDYVLKEVHLVEKFSDDRTKYKLIYEVIGELKGREETVIIIDGGEKENTNTPGGEDGNNAEGGEIKANPSNDPEWKIYMNQVRDDLRQEFGQKLKKGLNELRKEFGQELYSAKAELLSVINKNNEQTNKRIDGLESTLKQILEILKDKK
ncbi:hypothetical protein CJJ23_03630, partial [Mycoplasmopsis agassizii]